MTFRDALGDSDNAPENPSRRCPPVAHDPYGKPGGADPLDAFDRADGTTHVPAGVYTARVVEGGLVTTKAGKAAYRLVLETDAGPHAGHKLYRYYVLGDPDPSKAAAAANRAKAALTPLGLSTAAALRTPYPAPGREVTLRVWVGVQPRPDGTPSNDVVRFEVADDRAAPPNPNAVDPAPIAGGEGGAG